MIFRKKSLFIAWWIIGILRRVIGGSGKFSSDTAKIFRLDPLRLVPEVTYLFRQEQCIRVASPSLHGFVQSASLSAIIDNAISNTKNCHTFPQL